MDSPSGIPPEYILMGQRLDDLLICIRDRGQGISDLGGLPDFCGRLYRLVFDEGVGLIEAFDELGRQSNGNIYSTKFYSELVSGIDGELHTEQGSSIFSRNLIAFLITLKNIYL